MENVKILVPVDFSELSLKAVGVASKMAKLFNGTVTVFHSYIPVTEMDGFNLLGGSVATNENLKGIDNVIRKKLQEVVSKHLDADIANDPLVEIGNPARAIAEASENFDLIVMSTHGRTGFSRFIMGSVASKVLRTTTTPVLMVEEFSKTFPIENILVTTDLSENSYAAFPAAVSIAKKTGAKINLIHILSGVDFAELKEIDSLRDSRSQELKKVADKHFSEIRDKVKAEVLPFTKSVSEAIFDLNMSRKYNLIVMSTLGRTGLKYALLGSNAAKVVRNNETAVLTVNPKRDK